MGGGWPFGRVVNIVGDKSVGKTLLAEEAMAIFQKKYAKKPWYRETEAAFDPSYFTELGGDAEKVDFGPDGPDTHWQTIEAIIDDLRRILDEFDAEVIAKAKALRERNKRNKSYTMTVATADALKTMLPGIYFVDSLDALSSESEIIRAVKKRRANEAGREEQGGTYNLEKQKLLGELFRTEVKRLKRAKICLVFISQIRDRIGPMVRGKKYTRTGGKALDFYASLVIYLQHMKKINETIKGQTRATAIRVKAMCEKNKITKPFRDCEFELRFGYGMDDEWASLDYLKSVGKLGKMGLKDLPPSLKNIDVERLKRVTIESWIEIEKQFNPAKGKYAA
jgi:recombination protein RecA